MADRGKRVVSGVLAAFSSSAIGSGGGGSSGHLDSKSITVGAAGSSVLLNRTRGYIQDTIGNISDSASAIYGGNYITKLSYSEGAAAYILAIDGATNAGWTTLKIGALSLARTAATFSGGIWSWTTTDTVANQAFGAANTVVAIYFD